MDNLKKIYSDICKGKAVLLDVREKKEWEKIHFKNALLLPLSIIKEKKSHLENEKKYFIHCRAGRRALTAEKILKEEYPNKKFIALEYSFKELSQQGFIIDEKK